MLQYIQLRSEYYFDDVGGLVVGPPLSLSLSLPALSSLTCYVPVATIHATMDPTTLMM